MPNKHFCQGPNCHTRTTQDRFLKSRGVIRGRYAYSNMDKQDNGHYYFCNSDKYFCSQGCKNEWLNEQMDNIEQGRLIEFIRHRRESQGYQKVTTTHDSWNGGTHNVTNIQRINGTDN